MKIAEVVVSVLVVSFGSVAFAFQQPNSCNTPTTSDNLQSSRREVLGSSVATVATLGSLYFSEEAGYIPCRLCWYQRIFMYPLPILIALAIARRSRDLSVAASAVPNAVDDEVSEIFVPLFSLFSHVDLKNNTITFIRVFVRTVF